MSFIVFSSTFQYVHRVFTSMWAFFSIKLLSLSPTHLLHYISLNTLHFGSTSWPSHIPASPCLASTAEDTKPRLALPLFPSPPPAALLFLSSVQPKNPPLTRHPSPSLLFACPPSPARG